MERRNNIRDIINQFYNLCARQGETNKIFSIEHDGVCRFTGWAIKATRLYSTTLLHAPVDFSFPLG